MTELEFGYLPFRNRTYVSRHALDKRGNEKW